MPTDVQRRPGQVVGQLAGGPSAFLEAVEGAEDSAEAGAADLAVLGVSTEDVIVGIAASGRTPYVLGAMDHARQVGALLIGFSCNAGSPVEMAADVAITPVVGPEILSGSTRLKAGTATKLVLNMLSTGAMVRLGKCYDNQMVDVVASNEKLRRRCVRVVAQAAAVDYERARIVLERCGGEVKTAIVALSAGLDVDAARHRLAVGGGRVRAALAGR